jgi:hypothetical protein
LIESTANIEVPQMGVLVYIVFFVVACCFGWAVRGAS